MTYLENAHPHIKAKPRGARPDDITLPWQEAGAGVDLDIALDVDGRVGGAGGGLPIDDPSFHMSAALEKLAGMVTILWRCLGVRGAGAFARYIKFQVQELYAQEHKAAVLAIKQALRRCPEWQARVFEDLGGEAALARWRARLRRSYDTAPEDDYAWLDDDPKDWPVPDEALRKPGRTPKHAPKSGVPRARFKTDREGIFRWAPIAFGRDANRSARGSSRDWNFGDERSVQSSRPMRHSRGSAWPIELLPSDMTDAAEDEFEGDETAETDADPVKLWAQTQAVYEHVLDQVSLFLAQPRRACFAPLLVPP